MKKYLLVSLTILCTAAFMWAETAAPATSSVDVKANATLSWGIDLGKGDVKTKHGFKNVADVNVQFPLITKGDKESANVDMPVYGQVKIEEIELGISSEAGHKAFDLAGNIGKIDAKLYFYGAYLTIFNKPSFKANYAQIWKPVETDKKYDEDNYAIKPGFKGAGTKLGYANKNFMDLDVGLKLGSNGSWSAGVNKDVKIGYWKYFDGETALDDDEYIDVRLEQTVEVKKEKDNSGKLADVEVKTTPKYTGTYGPGDYPPKGRYYVSYVKKGDGQEQAHSKYGLGLDFSIKPLDKWLALDFTVNSTLVEGYTDKSNLAFGVKVSSEPAEGLNFTAAFDGGKDFADDAQFIWDALVKAEYKWISGGVYAYGPYTQSSWDKNASDEALLASLSGKDKNGKDITDFAFFLQFAAKDDKKEASYLLEGLDAGAHLGMYKLLTFAGKEENSKMQFPLMFKLWSSYKIGLSDSSWVKPFATAWAQTDFGTGKDTFALAYNLGVTYMPVEKVEITAKWEHGEKEKNQYVQTIKTPAGFKKTGSHNGRFTLAFKVIY